MTLPNPDANDELIPRAPYNKSVYTVWKGIHAH